MRLRNPSDDDWQRIKKQLLSGAWKVSEDGQWWIQNGLERTFQKQKEFRDQQRERANARWSPRDATSTPDSCRADAAAMPGGCSSSSSSSSNQNTTSKPCGSDSDSTCRKKTSPPTTAEGQRLAQMLRGHILRNNPNAKVTEARVQKWAHEADRMIRLDGRTHQQIADLIDFSQKDDFWFANILSMGKLREQFDQLTNQRKRKQQTFTDSHGAESPDESPSRPKWVGLTDDNERDRGER
jgi:beta-xylosidase